MKLTHWIADLPSRMRREGLRDGSEQASREVLSHLFARIDGIDGRGGRIYDEEWDVLILLDACRVDALQSVKNEYTFLERGEVGTFRSRASCSRLWMERNFLPEYHDEMARTAHVTANPFSDSYLDADDFSLLDEVWTYAWDEDTGTVPARNVTDRAITVARDHDPDRLIVHYMQPHFPSIPKPLGAGIDLENFGRGWESVWDRFRDGEIDRATVWSSYMANLRYVLNDVRLLLDSIDAERVVISSDHGNAFGEWWQYGHPPRIPISVLREVPWVVTSAENDGSYSPSIDSADVTVDNDDVEDRLRHLGYL